MPSAQLVSQSPRSNAVLSHSAAQPYPALPSPDSQDHLRLWVSQVTLTCWPRPRLGEAPPPEGTPAIWAMLVVASKTPGPCPQAPAGVRWSPAAAPTAARARARGGPSAKRLSSQPAQPSAEPPEPARPTFTSPAGLDSSLLSAAMQPTGTGRFPLGAQ